MLRVLIFSLFSCQILAGELVPAGSSGSEEQIKIDKRIVGGDLIEINAQPWIASIQANDAHICGGTIISDTVILTAAHCIIRKRRGSLSVRVGSSRFDRGGWTHKVSDVVAHENLAKVSIYRMNDLALLKVSPPFRLSADVQKVRLAEKVQPVNEGTRATVAGWGYTAERGQVSPALRRSDVFIVDSKKCAMDYGEADDTWMSSHGLICAAAPGRDACNGDSGGPFMVDGVQVGIVTWGQGCANPKYPGVYSNVSFYRDWIKEKTRYLESLQSSHVEIDEFNMGLLLTMERNS